MSDTILQAGEENVITRGDGFILLLFLSIFMYYVIEIGINSRKNGAQEVLTEKISWGKSIVFSILGLAAIIFGGNLVVKNGTDIAYSLGMSETLVGLTIIAIGTSLPELVTSVTAALKKESEIALGNIVGSNIFNILFVLGASAAISPLSIQGEVMTDVVFMIILTIILFIFSRTNYTIGKREGFILAITYIVYLVYIILRN